MGSLGGALIPQDQCPSKKRMRHQSSSSTQRKGHVGHGEKVLSGSRGASPGIDSAGTLVLDLHPPNEKIGSCCVSRPSRPWALSGLSPLRHTVPCTLLCVAALSPPSCVLLLQMGHSVCILLSLGLRIVESLLSVFLGMSPSDRDLHFCGVMASEGGCAQAWM